MISIHDGAPRDLMNKGGYTNERKPSSENLYN